MLPWMPMSPPSSRLRSVTYPAGGRSATTVLAHSPVRGDEVKTCFRVVLTNVANGSTSDDGQ